MGERIEHVEHIVRVVGWRGIGRSGFMKSVGDGHLRCMAESEEVVSRWSKSIMVDVPFDEFEPGR